jgi:DNA-binding transcriptional LysR family regulator
MDWDDARYFLAVARAGQMLGASRRLGVSQALLSRHIAALEAAIGARLLDRTTRGCALTEAGRELFAVAERIEAELLGAAARLHGAAVAVSGTVRIGAPDGFGSAFLAPRLGALRARHPGLEIELVPITRSFSLSRREADLAVMVGRPGRGRLRVRRLTDYTLGVYAGAAYLRGVAAPTTPADLARHPRVGYVEDLVYSPELHYAAELLPDWRADIAVASAAGQIEAVRGGAGIGILHDFMAARHDDLVRILPGLRVRRAYWTVWHEAMRDAGRVRAVAAFLDDIVRAAAADFVPDGGPPAAAQRSA